MNRANLITFMRKFLAEEVATESFWSDPALIDYLNFGYVDVVSRAELLQCTSMGATTAGEDEYAFPKDTIRVVRVFHKDPTTSKYKKLTDKTITELDLDDPQWTEKVCASGELPQMWAPRGQMFHVTPAPFQTQADGLQMWCIQSPPFLTDNSQAPEIPEAYHEAVAMAGCLRALSSDRTSQEAIAAADRLEPRVERAIAIAHTQHQRKAPDVFSLVDIRDFYQTATGWRS